MGSDTKQPRDHAQRSVPAGKLQQVEPDHAGEFVARPFSLTSAELGGSTATLASEPTHVLAWVRHPATAVHVRGLALAWTPQAVYIEWEDGGIHRAWVWAPAVERASPGQSVATFTPPLRHEKAVKVRDTRPLVEMVNAQLAQSGAEFITAMAQPSGPFAAIVFGSVEDHPVRLEFFIEPATDMCAVLLFDMVAKEVLAAPIAAATFQEAIEAYFWNSAIDALDLA